MSCWHPVFTAITLLLLAAGIVVGVFLHEARWRNKWLNNVARGKPLPINWDPCPIAIRRFADRGDNAFVAFEAVDYEST